MNMQRIIQHIGRGVCYAIAMVGLASCIADDLIEQPGTDKPLETGLYLGFVTAHEPNGDRVKHHRPPVQVLLTLMRLQRNPQCLLYCHIT